MSRIYFTDRDRGKQFPTRLRATGLQVEWFFDHFGDKTPDTERLGVVGGRGWTVITHDERIRLQGQRTGGGGAAPRRDAAGGGSCAVPTLAKHFVRTLPRIEAFVDAHRPPYIAKVFRPTPKESAGNANAPGTVKLWCAPVG